MGKDAIFSPKIIKNRITGEDTVVVHVAPTDLNWPWDKFNLRLVEFVKVWQEWQFAMQNEGTYSPSAEDPFVDADYQLIGEADVWLQSLSNMIEHDAQASILSPTGVCEGQVYVEINPLDRNGNEGPWEEDNEELDPFVEDPKQLLGTKINFVVKVEKIIFNVNVKEQACRYCDTFVRYKVNVEDPSEAYSETAHDTRCAIDPVFKYSQRHSVQVEEKMLKLFTKGRMIMQVWGKIAPKVASAGVPRLPQGWKRVTAYEDPEGQLHHHPPQM